ncbi:hypothetical protein J6590_106331 [Homalodisca vitripennis]|nr:hypothetical protein J6590_106331 [Homalodisca vitripennis]
MQSSRVSHCPAPGAPVTAMAVTYHAATNVGKIGGANTQRVERMWGIAKWRNKVQRATARHHLAEYMWRSAVAEAGGDRFDALLADIVAFWNDANTQ